MRIKTRAFLSDERGSLATAFAILLPVLITSVGVSVDLSRAYLVQNRLSRALDAAALAAASTKGDDDFIEDRFNDFFNANYPENVLGDPYDVVIDAGTDEVIVSAKANVETSFMQIVGIDYLTVSADATVSKSIGSNIELSMILDISGSMLGQKLTDLKAAANSLIDIVVYDNQDEYYSKVAIVPYSMAVNVGSYANSVRGTISSGTCTSPGCANYKFTNPSNQSKTFAISTCVSERTGARAYTDDAPSTQFMGRNYPSPDNPCLTSQILPLSNNKTTLKNRVNSLAASGSTGGHVGIGWGWYMIAPNFGYLWPAASRPAAYNTEELYKIAVIMTDGEYNSPYCNGVISKDAITGSGATTDHINCNAPNGSSYSQSRKLCDAMKAKGIEVYTVGFQIDAYPDGKAVMQYCASDAGHFYNAANGAQLKEAFQSIARNVSSLYLSK